VARVRVVFRRMETYSTNTSEIIRAADLTLDVARMRVMAQDREIEELTPTEFTILAAMTRYPGGSLPAPNCWMCCTALHSSPMNAPSMPISKNIRHKIEPNPPEPRYILTVYGIGYKFSDR